jgi:hypothetical protein
MILAFHVLKYRSKTNENPPPVRINDEISRHSSGGNLKIHGV